MSKKTQILCILTTIIFGVAMFIATSYKTSYADEVEGVYQVYLNGEKIGMIDRGSRMAFPPVILNLILDPILKETK